ncbi:MAG: hypothetical protein AABW73_01120 [Nanoarchaeota archaeon]
MTGEKNKDKFKPSRLAALGAVFATGFFSYLKIEDYFRYRLSSEELDKISLAEKTFSAGKARKEFPEVYSQVFDAISKSYVKGKHVCKDMSQEWRDWLVYRGVPYDKIRLVRCEMRTADGFISHGKHMFLELLVDNHDSTDGSVSSEWRAFDAANKRFNWPSALMDREALRTQTLPGDHIYPHSEIIGYKMSGDQWHSMIEDYVNVSEELKKLSKK